MEESKTVITGASGWLGRELIRILVGENRISPLNLHLIASTKKKFEINQNVFFTKKYNEIDESQEVENYFDFAFLTREKINILGPKKYIEANIGVINNSIENTNIISNNDYIKTYNELKNEPIAQIQKQHNYDNILNGLKDLGIIK